MRIVSAGASKIIATYFLIFGLPIALLMMAWSFLNVDEYDVKISMFENEALSIQDRKLPINHVRKSDQKDLVRSGEIFFDWNDNNPKYLFLRGLVGVISLALTRK